MKQHTEARRTHFSVQLAEVRNVQQHRRSPCKGFLLPATPNRSRHWLRRVLLTLRTPCRRLCQPSLMIQVFPSTQHMASGGKKGPLSSTMFTTPAPSRCLAHRCHSMYFWIQSNIVKARKLLNKVYNLPNRYHFSVSLTVNQHFLNSPELTTTTTTTPLWFLASFET